MGKNDGIENEKNIVLSLNDHSISRLSEYQKKFIKQLYGNVSDEEKLIARKVGGQGYKPDIEIELNGIIYGVSVKKGGGNSVHQEKTDFFIQYCMTELGMTELERDSLLLFLYGDGTTDGDSIPEERLSDKELCETYEKEIEIVQNFLDRNKRCLIERFLIYGRQGKEKGIKADYLYHGNMNDGIWCPLDFHAVDYLVSIPNSIEAPLSIGPLTIQVWNRNLDGRPDMEVRRHSIQVKWGSCRTHIKTINDLYLSELSRKKSVGILGRVSGDNHQGFDNQKKIVELSNNYRISQLPFALKYMVQKIYPMAAASEIISSGLITDQDVKARLWIEVKGEKNNLMLRMGSGNSVHQEKLIDFIKYCREDLGMNDNEEEALRTIIYGDGTLNGDSEAKDRLRNTEEVKSKYTVEDNLIQKFVDNNKEDLIERFLVYGKGGKKKNIRVDYIYYGTDVAGRIASANTVVEYMNKKERSESALLGVGSLTIQPWNRNPEAKPNLESRRHYIQVKWGGMKRDLANIAELEDENKGTSHGAWEEYDLVSKLNRDKNQNHKIWNTICAQLDIENLDAIHAVRVSKMVYSKISQRVVLPKTDVYLVRGKISHEVLLDNNYWLDEDLLENFDLDPIIGSGISCKRPASSHFTYAKLTINSFEKLFGNKMLGAAISLFVQVKEIDLNFKVLDAWGVTKKDFIEYFKERIPNIHNNAIVDPEFCRLIKKDAINQTMSKIKESKKISDAIFYGKGVFDEPYNANFLYKNGKIYPTYIPDFSITTGSGRHKGIFTIVIKPK